MEASDRAQYERADLAAGGEGLRRGTERGRTVYTVIALVIAVGLCIAAVKAINGWAQWVALGGIIVTMIGFMIAVSPTRRQAG